LNTSKLERVALKHHLATAKGFFVPFTASSSHGSAGFMRTLLILMYEQFYDALGKAATALIHDIHEVGFCVYDTGGCFSQDHFASALAQSPVSHCAGAGLIFMLCPGHILPFKH
jgi:deoxyhypusine synthase